MAYPASPSPELITPVTWLRLLGSWSMVVLFMIFGGQWLGDSLNGTTAAIVFLALFVTILAASFGVVREADHLAHQLGEPYGTLVTSLLGAFTPFYAAYAGTKAPVEHYTRAAAKEYGARGISVTAVGPGPMDTPFFYPAEGEDAVAYHKTAAALSPYSKTGLTDIEDVVPFIRHLVSDGWWITGQTILINGGYTTK